MGRILVLKHGGIVDNFDTVDNLMKDEKGYFMRQLRAEQKEPKDEIHNHGGIESKDVVQTDRCNGNNDVVQRSGSSEVPQCNKTPQSNRSGSESPSKKRLDASPSGCLLSPISKICKGS